MQKKKKLDENKARKKIKKLREQLPEPQKCSIPGCPNPLFETLASADAKPYMIGDKQVCKEHYFKELGEEIERNPIGGFPGRQK